MPRTSAAAVQAILLQDYDSANPLTAFVESANVFMDQVASAATARGTTLSAALLELLERWVAAHLYAMVDQTYAMKGTGGSTASFHGQTGMQLEATKYGQTALMLDTSGTLTVLGKRQVSAGIDWLGSNDQTPVWQR